VTTTSPGVPRARFALLTAASPLHDPAALRPLLESYRAPLRSLGGETWDDGPAPDAPLVVFVATGGTEQQILERARLESGEPALLVAHPGHNSLPAALEVLARARQMGLRGEVLFLRDPADVAGLARLAAAVRDRAVRRALRASRIALVGEPSDWLVASRPCGELVREVWGPEVVPLPIAPLLAEPDAGIRARAEVLARSVRDGAAAVLEPSEEDLLAASLVCALLESVAEAGGFDAVAVRCFDLVAGRGTTGCVALAHLNERGIVAGCEGDLASTVTMLWLRHLSGIVPWMANPSRVDRERGVLALAHCTVARSLTSGYRLRSHFESGRGVGLQGALPAGPVTLARIGGLRLERLRAIDGELLRNTDEPDLCRTQVEVEIGPAALDELLADPLGNHLVMLPGRWAADLRRWHAAMIG